MVKSNVIEHRSSHVDCGNSHSLGNLKGSIQTMLTQSNFQVKLKASLEKFMTPGLFLWKLIFALHELFSFSPLLLLPPLTLLCFTSKPHICVFQDSHPNFCSSPQLSTYHGFFLCLPPPLTSFLFLLLSSFIRLLSAHFMYSVL